MTTLPVAVTVTNASGLVASRAASIDVSAVAFPNSTNTGHLNAPGYPGALAPWPSGTGFKQISNGTNATSGSGTAADPWVFKFFDFDGVNTTSGTLVSGSNMKFVGCRFQSNSFQNYNIQTTGSNLTFSYCSVVPRVALVGASPPNAAWPSSGAGQQLTIDSANYSSYVIDKLKSYQYGINIMSGGPVTVSHCDVWGFGNAILFYSTTAQMIIDSCWIHDGANCVQGGTANYHLDGIGYVNDQAPPRNVSITNCTIAMVGNTQNIAFQPGSSPYANISVVGNYISGNSSMIDMCHNTPGSTGLVFTDNIIGSDLPSYNAIIYTSFANTFTQSQNPTNLWRRNKLQVLPGTFSRPGGQPPYTVDDNGKFVLPNNTLNATDWAL